MVCCGGLAVGATRAFTATGAGSVATLAFATSGCRDSVIRGRRSVSKLPAAKGAGGYTPLDLPFSDAAGAIRIVFRNFTPRLPNASAGAPHSAHRTPKSAHIIRLTLRGEERCCSAWGCVECTAMRETLPGAWEMRQPGMVGPRPAAYTTNIPLAEGLCIILAMNCEVLNSYSNT